MTSSSDHFRVDGFTTVGLRELTDVSRSSRDATAGRLIGYSTALFRRVPSLISLATSGRGVGIDSVSKALDAFERVRVVQRFLDVCLPALTEGPQSVEVGTGCLWSFYCCGTLVRILCDTGLFCSAHGFGLQEHWVNVLGCGLASGLKDSGMRLVKFRAAVSSRPV